MGEGGYVRACGVGARRVWEREATTRKGRVWEREAPTRKGRVCEREATTQKKQVVWLGRQ